MTARAEYLLKTDDDILIGINNFGMIRGALGQMEQVTGGGDVDAGVLYLRLSTRFEAPAGRYDWLNNSIFVGVLLPPESMEKVSWRSTSSPERPGISEGVAITLSVAFKFG